MDRFIVSGIADFSACWHTNAMKSLTEQLWFEVPNRRGFVNITPKVEELVRQSGVVTFPAVAVAA
jgi:hypothetical protein